MYYIRSSLIIIGLLLAYQGAFARSVIIAKRETATFYSLKLINLETKESIILESKKAEFNIPEDLEGEYSLQVSFTDKWGRKIEGNEPKVIKLVNKRKPVEKEFAASENTVAEPSLLGIIFTPYIASGTYTADLNDSNISLKQGTSSFSSTGLRTILKINSLKQFRFGADIMQSSNATKSLNSTEASIIYDWFKLFYYFNVHF
jgi:hypothetical protein